MMNDRISLAEKLCADIGAYGRISRRTLVYRLGVAAAVAAAASLATVPAPAQSQQQTPGAQPTPPKAAAPAPKRRGITAPESSAPSPSGDKSKGDDDSIPGGLPGARPKSQPVPGGGPSNPGG
jgi:hypothetical protein